MGRAPCCDKANVKKGPWSPEEDAKLKAYIEEHGTGGNWIALPQKIGLKRCGKSCRLRWLNYLRPNIKHGGFSEEEDNIICSLYISIGSRWSIIAAQLPGRTDNDIKNYWNTKLKKKLMGRQRKEQQARRARIRQEISRETETTLMAPASVMTSNNYQQHTHYWPEIPVIMPAMVTNTTTNQLDNLNFMDEGSIRNLLVKLGGRFSDDHQVHQDQSNFINTKYQVVADSYSSQEQLYASSKSILSSPATMNSIDSTDSTNYSINGGDQIMVQGIENYPIELNGYEYGISGQELEGLEGLYGMDQMANVGSMGTGTSSTSGESSSWPGNMNSLVYETQLVSEYGTNCLQSMPQDSPIEDSSHHHHYFGSQ